MVNTLRIRAGRIVVSGVVIMHYARAIHIIHVLLISFTVYQCHISGHSLETLPLTPGVRRFCVFSVAFSNDGTEILGGANDNCLYIYDLECQQRILRVRRIIIQQ